MAREGRAQLDGLVADRLVADEGDLPASERLREDQPRPERPQVVAEGRRVGHDLLLHRDLLDGALPDPRHHRPGDDRAAVRLVSGGADGLRVRDGGDGTCTLP